MPRSETTESYTICPHCGRRNELHTGIEGTQPKDGDLAVCWGCRKLGIFVVGPLGLSVRATTDEEAEDLGARPDVRALLAAMTESYDPVTAAGLWAGR